MKLSPILIVALLCATARADVPPDPDSAEAHCTLAEQCPGGTTCPYAFRPQQQLERGVPPVGQQCRSGALASGLEQRCRHGGNYAGDEIFCPRGAIGSWKAKRPTKGCAVAGAPSETGSLGVGVVLALLAIRRRARADRASGASPSACQPKCSGMRVRSCSWRS